MNCAALGSAKQNCPGMFPKPWHLNTKRSHFALDTCLNLVFRRKWQIAGFVGRLLWFGVMHWKALHYRLWTAQSWRQESVFSLSTADSISRDIWHTWRHANAWHVCWLLLLLLLPSSHCFFPSCTVKDESGKHLNEKISDKDRSLGLNLALGSLLLDTKQMRCWKWMMLYPVTSCIFICPVLFPLPPTVVLLPLSFLLVLLYLSFFLPVLSQCSGVRAGGCFCGNWGWLPGRKTACEWN